MILIKRRITILTIFTFMVVTLFGQNYSKQFGQISIEELAMKSNLLDKDAEALVLFDIGKSYFERREDGFVVVFERSVRLKVFSEAGIKWAQVEIPFYQEGNVFERVTNIESNTYNLENNSVEKTALNPSNALDEKLNNSWNLKKFVIPGVKSGSVIEYRYRIESDYLFNLQDWSFQWRIPVLYSEYEVRMIPFYEYTYLLQGAKSFDFQKSYLSTGVTKYFGGISYNDMIHRFVKKNVPAFKDEEFISSINDYIIKLDFQLSKIVNTSGTKIDVITTWDKMIKLLINHESFGKYVKKSENMGEKLPIINELVEKSEKEKFDHILDYVKSNYSWNNENDKYASKSPSKFVSDKQGNCADINLFTIGLLNSAGVESYPLLISTRSHGKIKYDYPYSHFFNYVLILAKIDGNEVVSDATDLFGLNDRIPARCINDKGLVIQKDKVLWKALETTLPSEKAAEYLININADNKISANIKRIYSEYDASNLRKALSSGSDDIQKIFGTKEISVLPESVKIQNQSVKDKPLMVDYNIISNVRIVDENIFLNPFLDEVISDNPLKQDSRVYPIDMIYPAKRTFKSTITIPEGYTVVSLPEPQMINDTNFEMSYKAIKNDNTVTIDLYYYFKKSVYPSSDYALVKYYFNTIINKGIEKIVLSKIVK
jgi:hypothetical protein